MAARRSRDLVNRLRECQQPGASQLVELANMTIIGERGYGNLRDVIGVDEGLLHGRHRERNFAVEHLIHEEPFAEVLTEPGRSQDRPVRA